MSDKTETSRAQRGRNDELSRHLAECAVRNERNQAEHQRLFKYIFWLIGIIIAGGGSIIFALAIALLKN